MSLPNPQAPLAFQSSGPIYGEFVRQANDAPGSTALVSSHGSCSYGELNLLSNRLANLLLSRGTGKGQTVAILAERSPALIYAVLGVSKCGAAFCISDASYPTARILECLDLVSPALLVVAGDLALSTELESIFSDAQGKRVIRIPVNKDEAFQALAEFDDTLPAVGTTLDDIAYIGFTSGSTGRPKGIATSHAPLPHFVDWHIRQHQLTNQDQFSLLSGLSHDPVLRDIFAPLSIGAALHIPPQATIFEPSHLFEWLSERQITVCHVTPSLGEIITAGAQGRSPLHHLRYCFWGGEVLRSRVARGMFAIAPNVNQVNFYGATETPQAMGHFRLDRGLELETFPIGNGIDDVQLLVVDRAGKLLDPGQVGEIWIRTRYLSLGYLGDPEQTAAKFVTNPYGTDARDRCYRTGDEGRYLADGNVEFVGRSDHQVKIRGFRVELGEIAIRIERCPGVRKAIVLGRDVPGRDQVVVAYLASEVGREVAITGVRDRLKLELPSYMVPSFMIHVERFPLLPNGKVDLQALPRIEDRSESPTTGYVPPSTDRERELASVWQELLGLPRVGVNDSFTDLGGDSLAAIRALIRMRKLGIPDDLSRGIFQGRTIAQIAREESGDDSNSPAVPMADGAKTTLAVDVLRAILIILLVADHWCEGFLKRLPASAHWLGSFLAPLFNVATPGFAFVFGLGLGYVQYSLHRSSPARAAASLRFGALLVGGGVLMANVFGLIVARLQGTHVTSHVFFVGFFEPLIYYLLALLSMPWWFRLIGRFRNPLLGCGAMIALAYALHRVAIAMLLGREQVGFLQLCRLALVAKYAYFNMSIGVLGGIAAGIVIKAWNRRPTLALALLTSGTILAIIGLGLLYIETGNWGALHDSDDLAIWRWVFYSGVVLVAMGLIRKALQYYESIPRCGQEAFKWSGVLGQCTLPVVVLHELVLRGKAILRVLGVPEVFALAIPLVVFFVAIATAARRIYILYYGVRRGAQVRREAAVT